jgi:diguanylate cyclase (GGDEF)-like protein
LRFPSEDIPKKARELYASSSLRIMADVDAVPVKLIPEILPSGKKADQSHMLLRSMSLMHVKYLKNMGVRASMSIGLMSGNKLWGLMAFHHYSPKIPPYHLVSEMKASCELFTAIILTYLKPELTLDEMKVTMNGKNAIEQAFRSIHTMDNDFQQLKAVLIKLRKVLKQDFVGIVVGERGCVATKKNTCIDINSYLKFFEELLKNTTDNKFEAHDLLAPNSQHVFSKDLNMAGISIQRSEKLPELMVLFGKDEVQQTIKWGGVPETVNIKVIDGERHLEPRSSFSLWRQKVIGYADKWTDIERQMLHVMMSELEDCVLRIRSEEIKTKLHNASYQDALTGLPNRRYLEEYINSLALDQEHDKMITVFFLDLDNFKNINDCIGHEAGDILLQKTAERLTQCVRPEDLVVRLGGDEFILVIEHVKHDQALYQDTSIKISETIIRALSKPFFHHGLSMLTTPSIGALICNPRLVSYTDILKRSDIAMYHAKTTGKNKVHFFSEVDQIEVNVEVNLVNELRKAIQHQAIKVHYQPQFNNKHHVTGAEALARWDSPTHGSISPDVFIALAEKNNLISELGIMIFSQACSDLARWKNQKKMPHFETLSINVSAHQLADKNFGSNIKKIVRQHKLRNQDIRIELTESVFMHDFDATVSLLNELRHDGFSISLDDFGTGFSSLSYLLKLPIDEVKIDQSFVKNITESDDALVMVESIIKLCKKMNFEIIAEGVEDKRQLSLLTSFGCDTFQGFYFSSAVPVGEIEFDG